MIALENKDLRKAREYWKLFRDLLTILIQLTITLNSRSTSKIFTHINCHSLKKLSPIVSFLHFDVTLALFRTGVFENDYV